MRPYVYAKLMWIYEVQGLVDRLSIDNFTELSHKLEREFTCLDDGRMIQSSQSIAIAVVCKLSPERRMLAIQQIARAGGHGLGYGGES